MNKQIKKLGIFLILFMIAGLIPAKPCLAASAEVSISADATQITEGDSFFVYINLESTTAFGDFEANLTYNDEVLEYQGGASVVSGGSGYLKISDMGVLDGDTSRKYTLEFKALQVGYCKIAFSDRAVVYDFESGNEMSVSSTELTINVSAPQTASTNAELKSLNVSPTGLTPVFDPAVLEYSISVGYDTQQLFITAIPQDSKSSVSISGNDLLKEGENKVVVSVLAESGNVIEYIINVTREAKDTDPATDDIADEPLSPNTFTLVETDGVKYVVYSGSYTILEADATVEIPEGYKEGTLIISGVSITAYLPVDHEESEFILVYAMNEFQEAGFYQYDRVEKTMQRYVPDSMIIHQSGLSSEEKDELTQSYQENMTIAIVIITILAGLSVIMSFVVIRQIVKNSDHESGKKH